LIGKKVEAFKPLENAMPVMLSEAKHLWFLLFGLPKQQLRFFASLRMTVRLTASILQRFNRLTRYLGIETF
jgi:hypothetical protein